jgi:molybdopterin/thiamine biosynthesis adenylyltransferase
MPGTPYSATIDDPSGVVRSLVQLLDGTRSVPDICHSFPDAISPEEAAAVLTQLIDAGYVEDATTTPPVELFRHELRRYDRNLEFFSFFSTPSTTRYAPQVALKDARVTLLGVGGLGCHVALHLAGLGVGRLQLIDFDTVEESNLNRQLLFTDEDIGQPKATAAARHLSGVNPLVEVTATEYRIRQPSDALRCFDDTDLLICAADRPRVDLDRWINAAALVRDTPWLRGASVGLTAVLNYYHPGRTACVECQLLAIDEPHESPGSITEQVKAAGDRLSSPCIAPVAGLLGAAAAFEAMKLLTGVAPTALLHHEMVIDLVTMETHFLESRPHPRCTSCLRARVPRHVGNGRRDPD